MDVRTIERADEALELLGGALRQAGAEGEMSYGVLARLVDDPHAWGAEVTILAGMDGDDPAALVSMTGSFPALIVGFGDPATTDFAALADGMLASGRRPSGVNGAVRWSDPFTAMWGEHGADPSVQRDMRAFELRRVVPPRGVEGRFREAGAGDIPRLAGWVVAMGDDIDEPIDADEAADVAHRVTGNGDLCVWEVGDTPTSMAGITRRTPWSSCVALVYTPPEHRRRGYASSVVAALSQRELDAGCEWCSLFTDLANPTSNHIYAELGYEPRCDFRHYALDWP